MKWDRYVGSPIADDGGAPACMWIKYLFKIPFTNLRVDLHKMVQADGLQCYHTHPYRAWRLVLRGGYAEEMENGDGRFWFPGDSGFVEPNLSHRVSMLLNGDSYSLWVHGPSTHGVELRGAGWGGLRMDT